MRKLFLAISAIAFISVSTQAQTSSFGLKAGMTSANIKMSGNGMSLSMTSKIGFYAGAMADIGISENFSVQPELLYEALGAKAKSSDPDFGGDGSINLGYINLPILLKYKNEGFSAFVGPQIGYLLSAKSKSDGETTDEKDSFKSTEVSGVIGAGYTLTNGFGFDARYQMGLSNISKESGEDATVKNNAFMVGIHYFFNR